MPFTPDDRDPASTITIGEYNRKMGAVHKLLDSASKRAEGVGGLEQSLADAQAKLSTMPDSAKAAKRLEKAEKERDEHLASLTAERADRTTEKALLTAGITTADDQEYVRWKYEKSGEQDFDKFVTKIHAEDKYFAAPSAPAGDDAPPPADTPANATPPNINGGAKPPPALAKEMTLGWLAARPPEWWSTEPKAHEIAAKINGVPPLKSRRS